MKRMNIALLAAAAGLLASSQAQVIAAPWEAKPSRRQDRRAIRASSGSGWATYPRRGCSPAQVKRLARKRRNQKRNRCAHR